MWAGPFFMFLIVGLFFILFSKNVLMSGEYSLDRGFYIKGKTRTATDRAGPGSMIYAAIAVCGYFCYSPLADLS